MSRPPQPGGARAANNSGNIQARELASGELRYHARFRKKFLGSFCTRAEAERAVAAARVVQESSQRDTTSKGGE